MCLTTPAIRWSGKWNWDGDRILHDAIVPSSRPAVGELTGGYDIDVREFLVTEHNAVMRRTLEKDVRAFVSKLPGASWELFTSRRTGAFDHRANVIAMFVGEKIQYVYSGGYDAWQFPDETLHLKAGDCEDRALLIASLLLASGVSSFNVRVALGKFRSWDELGRRQDRDHVWVMYKSEVGQWQIIEPLHARAVRTPERAMKSEAPARVEYVPQFLFNDVHLWGVLHEPGEAKLPIRLKRDWSRVHPTFGGLVHKTILNRALTKEICPPWVLATLNRHFTSYLWIPSLTVDEVDAGSYDPRDHFDNGYIAEGWKRVANRLAVFDNAPATNLDAFFYAAHGIADFYAHSSYAHFARQAGQPVPLYDPSNPSLPRIPDYGPGGDFDLASGRFSLNTKLWNGTPAQAAAQWKGQLITGRYAQPRDPHGVFEAFTSIPKKLRDAPGFAARGSLPHHDEIAIDAPTPGRSHCLYTKEAYSKQYDIRVNLAVRHIRHEFVSHWKP